MDGSGKSISSKILGIYKKRTYGDKYGGELWFTVIVLGVFFATLIYFYIIGHLSTLRKDWPNNRCNPLYMPFAGIINPQQNESSWSYIGRNYEYCTQNILTDIADVTLAPLNLMVDIEKETIHILSGALNDMRNLFHKIRDEIMEIITMIMNTIYSVIIGISETIITMQDMLKKTSAINMTTLYTLLGGKMIFGSIFTIIKDAAIVIMGFLTILIIATAFTPWISVPAAVTLALIAGIYVELVPLVNDVTTTRKPPMCFAKNTPVLLENGTYKPIHEILVGDILPNESNVTGIMKLSSRDQELYDVNGILVTEKHRIFHPELGLIQASAHPLAIKINDFREQYVYCINTSSKRIHVGDDIYMDWDDLDTVDTYELETQCANVGILTEELAMKDIHSHLECGLVKDSMIELDDGRSLPIQEIEVNDMLRFGETVLGVIKIDAHDVINVKEYAIDENRRIRSSGNLFIMDNDLGTINTFTISGTDICDEQYLYHLVTDTGKFVVDGIRIGDYNTGLEQHLKPVFLSR